VTIAVGIAVGSLVGGLFACLFSRRSRCRQGGQGIAPSRETASWIALRGTLVVMPVFVLALTDPSFYLAAIMKTVPWGSRRVRPTPARPGANWSDRP
jgi:hypothetical protein